jgi:L-seryl-tRNA(Ser) seleniumtransferase
MVVYSIRMVLQDLKANVKNENDIPEFDSILKDVVLKVTAIKQKSLIKVYNATGIVMHTNLGRAPFSEETIIEATQVLQGYNNLEFDLKKGKRGSRYNHVSELLKFLTGAGDVLVVNNNAAAIMLILRAFAKNKEVVISRGELIEIGGSFRMPDILAASDCKMVEVGTTNKTRLTDFESKINENTGAFVKAHPSNFRIEGFTDSVDLKQLVDLGKRNNIPVFYDMGSGLLQHIPVGALKNEPNVQKTLETGVDLVCFSGDKLLGGPQAGIIAGRSDLIATLKKDPLVRALRVCKLTLGFLETVCMQYLDHEKLIKNNLIYQYLSQEANIINYKANKLQKELKALEIEAEIVDNEAQFGGGALPGRKISSKAVRIITDLGSRKLNSEFAENLFKGLLEHDTPALGILKKGGLFFDIYCMEEKEIEPLSKVISEVYRSISL